MDSPPADGGAPRPGGADRGARPPLRDAPSDQAALSRGPRAGPLRARLLLGAERPGVFSLAVSAADSRVRRLRAERAVRQRGRRRRGASSRRRLDLPRSPRGASRRGRGRRTSAGSPRARTTPRCCSSASSSAASCARLDGGASWQDHRPGAQRDVHSLAWHATDADRAYEAGGGGSAWSVDRGDTWRPADSGRDRHYTWAVAADPGDSERWFVSASTGPLRRARRPRPRRPGSTAGGRRPVAAAGRRPPRADRRHAARARPCGRAALRRARRRPGLRHGRPWRQLGRAPARRGSLTEPHALVVGRV